MDLIIRGGLLAGIDEVADIGIDGGRIVQIEAYIPERGAEEIDASGNLVSMGFIDAHIHADKAFTAGRIDHEIDAPDGYLGRVARARRVKESFDVQDVRRRASRLFEMAAASGTTTMRTQVELDPILGTVAAEGIRLAAADCSDIIHVQTVAFPQEGWLDCGWEMDCRPDMRAGLEMGFDAVGGNINPELFSDVREQIDDVLALAREFGIAVDIDLDIGANGVGYNLPYLARCIEAMEFGGHVTAAHLTALSHVPEPLRDRAIRAAAEAGISVCSPGNPATPIRSLLEAGVNVTLGTDNVRDAFSGLGNADMLDTGRFLARVNRMHRPAELAAMFAMCTRNAARALGLGEQLGLAVGRRADLVILETEDVEGAIRDVVARPYVIKGGRVIARYGTIDRWS